MKARALQKPILIRITKDLTYHDRWRRDWQWKEEGIGGEVCQVRQAQENGEDRPFFGGLGRWKVRERGLMVFHVEK